METILIRNATKKIKNTCVYKNINIVCEAGSIVGLIGKNGAGKTMLLKSICGLTSYNDGEIYVMGRKIGFDVEIPESIGVIIETPGFFPNISEKVDHPFALLENRCDALYGLFSTTAVESYNSEDKIYYHSI